MNFLAYKRECYFWCTLLLFFAAASSCSSGSQSETDTKSIFGSVTGIKFIEYRREFESGYCFSEYGFQQQPEWIMNFFSEDSVKIFSPKEGKFLHYLVHFDHDSVFNIAREWVRVKAVSKDSIIFQLLQVEGRAISRDRSNVFMKFYSEDYIRRALRTTAEELKRPLRKDSLFIKRIADRANRNPGNVDSAFAARKPVELKSITDNITIERSHGAGDDFEPSPADEYLYPEFSIAISGAYKNFDYQFSVLVDHTGRMRLGKFLVSEEFRASRTRVLQGIIDVYLQKYLKVNPGETLGFPHTSEVLINLKGRS